MRIMQDRLLFIYMRQAADALARWLDGLDYSIKSLDVLDASLTSTDDLRPTIRDAGAYLGEVLIRHGNFTWGWPERYCCDRGDEPGLQAPGAGWVDVFSAIRRRKARRPQETLRVFAELVLEYAASPDEVTAARLGLTKKYARKTNSELTRWKCQRLRARLSVRRRLRQQHVAAW